MSDPVRRQPWWTVLAVGAILIASSPACVGTDRLAFGNERVQEGFRDTGAGSTQQSGDGPVRYVQELENTGPPAASATFVVVLRENDGRTVWRGRATIEDIATGETFDVAYESDEPLPPDALNVQWRVEKVIR